MMSLFIERTAFNHELTGKACKLEGYSHSGAHYDCYVLVHNVKADKIYFLRHDGRKMVFTEEDFNHGEDSLNITIMEVEDID